MKKNDKRLMLNSITVARLNHISMTHVNGGAAKGDQLVQSNTGSGDTSETTCPNSESPNCDLTHDAPSRFGTCDCGGRSAVL